MTSLYISTGRKPTQTTRKLSRLLSLVLNSKYEGRGKKSIDEICARAEKFGCTRIAFIYEKKGNPSAIQFYDEENGWLKEELWVLGINLPKREREGRIPGGAKLIAEDGLGEKMLELFNLGEESRLANSKLEGVFSSTGIKFTLNGILLLDIKCKISKGKTLEEDKGN